jgi:AcrR family transcriptional regulator
VSPWQPPGLPDILNGHSIPVKEHPVAARREGIALTEAAPSKAPEERRRRILEATVGVIRERGFAGARVSDIAAAAGTSSGLVLYHFGSLAGAMNEALTWLEDGFYLHLQTDLSVAAGPLERLALMAEQGSGAGPAVGDWTLWLELWVRALRDDSARAARESLDGRWRTALREVITEGTASGVFHPADPDASTIRLACLMDGLAIQLTLEDPGMTAGRFRDLWLTGAANELGVDPASFGLTSPG